MSKAYAEIDFFQMEKRNNASSKPSSPERAPSSFRGIQNVVSRINPHLLKTVMAAGAAGHASLSGNIAARPTSSKPPPLSPMTPSPLLPVYNNASTFSLCPPPDTAPFTIFYNGTVTTFDVPREKAVFIMRVAQTGVAGNPAEKLKDYLLDVDQLEGDLPIARRKSLQRFLEKRKDRFTLLSPYYRPAHPVPDEPRGADSLALGSIDKNN